MSVLICGGAGYIGSHNVRALLDRGESVVVLDNLWTGHRAALPESVPFYEGDVRDTSLSHLCTFPLFLQPNPLMPTFWKLCP